MATKEEILESIAQMSVMEVADLIKMMEDKFGVQAAAAAVAAGPAVEAAAVVEEPTEFNVILKACDPTKKIAAIKEVRAITGLGLKEAKELVEAGDKIVKESVSKADAASLKEKLEAASCTVEIKPVD
jgi:large subunit ribosomal protein L7/L12